MNDPEKPNIVSLEDLRRAIAIIFRLQQANTEADIDALLPKYPNSQTKENTTEPPNYQ